jgi:hypothetical protein
MNTEEMIAIFENNSVPEYYYTVRGLGGGECYGIQCESGCWSIYYSERGNKTIVSSYDNEDSVCISLMDKINKMMKDDFGREIVM